MRKRLAASLRRLADRLDPAAPDPWKSKSGKVLQPAQEEHLRRLADRLDPIATPEEGLGRPGTPIRSWLPGEWGGPYV